MKRNILFLLIILLIIPFTSCTKKEDINDSVLQDKKDYVLSRIVEGNKSIGIIVSQEEIDELRNGIEDTISRMALENKISKIEAINIWIEEIDFEMSPESSPEIK